MSVRLLLDFCPMFVRHLSNFRLTFIRRLSNETSNFCSTFVELPFDFFSTFVKLLFNFCPTFIRLLFGLSLDLYRTFVRRSLDFLSNVRWTFILLLFDDRLISVRLSSNICQTFILSSCRPTILPCWCPTGLTFVRPLSDLHSTSVHYRSFPLMHNILLTICCVRTL